MHPQQQQKMRPKTGLAGSPECKRRFFEYSIVMATAACSRADLSTHQLIRPLAADPLRLNEVQQSLQTESGTKHCMFGVPSSRTERKGCRPQQTASTACSASGTQGVGPAQQTWKSSERRKRRLLRVPSGVRTRMVTASGLDASGSAGMAPLFSRKRASYACTRERSHRQTMTKPVLGGHRQSTEVRCDVA